MHARETTSHTRVRVCNNNINTTAIAKKTKTKTTSSASRHLHTEAQNTAKRISTRTTSKPRSNDATTKTTSTSTSTSPSSTTTSNQKARLDSSYSHSLGECASFRIMPVLSGEVLWHGSVGVLERNLKFRRRGRVCFLYSRWSPIHYSNLSYSLETSAMTMLPSKRK